MLKLYNTLGKTLEEFKPINKGQVKIYQCGPTVYSIQHIGNMRAMVLGDSIRRSLSFLGYNVSYVRNYTDFGHLTGDNIGDADIGEDRLEKAAKKEGITPNEIADKYIKFFETDVFELNTLPPTVTARATDYIDAMIEMVQGLIQKGFAYVTPSAIFFEVDKFSEYTKLSGQKLEMNISGEGHGDVLDSNKKKPYDFAIWFFRTGDHANALQYWPSPFSSPLVENGFGFPGWHIECSAMILKTLGETIDIHMGGIEHIPTHHTNEIAQSESFTGKKYVNYWLHNEHLLVDGKKMSKSEGTAFNVQELKDKGFNPISLRYLFLQSHYRSKQNFTFESLEAAQTALKRLKVLVNDLIKEFKDLHSTTTFINADYIAEFTTALEDDFNLPKALSIVWDILKSNLASNQKLATILELDKVLGLNLASSIEDPVEVVIPPEAQILIEERKIARINKDWQKSDELRDRLLKEFNIKVKDTKDSLDVELG